jgi:uncharacterized membrane protein
VILNKKWFSGLVALIGGVIGFIASFLLTIDKIKLLKDSQFVPSCNISETLNCKSVMLSEQAEVFGFPNSLLGIGAFAIFIAIGVALLAGVEFPSWFWQIALVGTVLAILFSHWLAYQTTFVIGALCPYCMVAWVGNFMILSSVIQELLRPKFEGPDGSSATERIVIFMPIFHLLWVSMVIGSAFLAVN